MTTLIKQEPLKVVSSVQEFLDWRKQEFEKGRRILVNNTVDSNEVPCFIFLSANMDKTIQDELENYVQVNHQTITDEWVKSIFENLHY